MADNFTPIEHVSDTALWVATFRAREGRRKKPLFHDPYSGILAGDRGEWIARNMERSRYTAWSVVIRTCIIDTYIETLIGEGADAVLNIGAGLDTRPYRLSLPKEFQWFEADYEPLLALKNEKLVGKPANCALERWAVDLNHPKARDTLFAQVSERAKNVIVLTYVIDPATQDKIGAINVGPGPQQIAFGFKGLQGPNAYVTVAGLNRVVVVSADPSNLRILEQIDVGQRPNGISNNREGTRLFVVHETSNDLKVIDTGSSSVLATVPVGRKPIRVVYHGS
jgi:YVTN family beta-propeller protein